MLLPKTPDPSRKGKRARADGYRWQREVARRLRRVFPEPQFRVLEGEPDVVVMDDDGEVLLHVEAKYRRCRVDLRAALEQAKLTSRPTACPVAVCKGGDGEPVALLPFRDLLDLLANWAPPVGA